MSASCGSGGILVHCGGVGLGEFGEIAKYPMDLNSSIAGEGDATMRGCIKEDCLVNMNQ